MRKISLVQQFLIFFFFISALLCPLHQSYAMENVRLQLKWKHQFQFAGYYAAKAKGFYAERGLDVVFIEGKPGGNEINELVSGRADFAVSMSDALVERMNGQPIVVLANIFQHSPVIFLTMKQSKISSPQDLFGKSIMMTPGRKSAELQAMLLNEGIGLDKVQIVTPSWNIDDLISGKIAALGAYISTEPYLLRKKNIPYTIISPRTYGIDFYGDNLITTESEIEKHPKRVETFREASLKGWKYALENQDEIIDLILKDYNSNGKLTRGLLMNEAAAYQKLILPEFVKTGHVNPGRWKHIADTYVSLGMLEKNYSLDNFLYAPSRTKFYWGHWAVKAAIGLILLAFGMVLVLALVNRRINREIGIRIKAEKKIREGQELFKAVFEQAGGYCLLLEPTDDGIPKILDANEAACRAHGYKKEDMIGRPVADLDDEEGKRQCRKNTEIILSGETLAIENYHLKKDGTAFPVAVYANRVDFEDKPPLIVSTEFDITDRYAAQEELKRQRDLFELVINSVPARIFWKDLNLVYLGCNVHFAKDSGEKTPEDVIGKNDYDLVWKADADVYRTDDMQVINTGKAKLKYEESILNKNGEKNVWLTSKIPLKGADGKIIGVLAASENITEQKLVDMEKQKLESQLRQAQKMESIGNLAGGIAHDFNNILSSVIGFTELSLDEVERGSTLEDNLHEVYSAGKRAKDLVNQILAFARKSEKEVKPVQPYIIVKEVLQFIRASIPTTIEIKQTIESDSFILGNPTQIYQIYMNLFTNAAHAMEDRGGMLELSMKDISLSSGSVLGKGCLKPGDYIKIKVSDTGTGIPKEIIQSIFEPYFTTKGLGEGTGLGLAMVQGVIESYGGKIEVESRVGKGSTFSTYLPIIKKRKSDSPYQSEALPSGTERILFIDDEVAITKMGVRNLESLGYSVTAQTDSLKALELFRSKPEYFDLVISDMTMPKMTGDVLAVELMAIRADIPIVLCTGYSKKISEKTAVKMGIKALVYKPIVKSELAKTIRKVLDDARG